MYVVIIALLVGFWFFMRAQRKVNTTLEEQRDFVISDAEVYIHTPTSDTRYTWSRLLALKTAAYPAGQ